MERKDTRTFALKSEAMHISCLLQKFQTCDKGSQSSRKLGLRRVAISACNRVRYNYNGRVDQKTLEIIVSRNQGNSPSLVYKPQAQIYLLQLGLIKRATLHS